MYPPGALLSTAPPSPLKLTPSQGDPISQPTSELAPLAQARERISPSEPSSFKHQARSALRQEGSNQIEVEDVDDFDDPVSYQQIFMESKEAADSDKASTLSLESDASSQKNKGEKLGTAKTRPSHQLGSVRKPLSVSKARRGHDVVGDTIVEGQEKSVKGSVRIKQPLLKPLVSKALSPASSSGRQRGESGATGKVSVKPPGVRSPSVSKTSGAKRTLPSPPIKRASPASSSSKKKMLDVKVGASSPVGQRKATPSKDQRTEQFLLSVDSIPDMPISENKELARAIAVDYGPKWSMFGRYLGLSDEDIEDIKENCLFDNERCARVIVKWLESTELRPTYAKIACALVNTHQYHKIDDLKKLVPHSSYDSSNHCSMHVVKLPLGEDSLGPLMEEMSKEREIGSRGAEVTVRSASGDGGDFPVEGLVFCLVSLGSRELRVVEYVLKAAATDGVGTAVVSLSYFQ